MAIIYSYPEKASPAGGDFLVITDSEQPAPNKNRTKSLTIDNLASYVITSQSGITGSGTINTIPVFTGTTSIGDSGLVYTTTGGGSASNLPLYAFGGSADVTMARIILSDIFCNNISAAGGGTVTFRGNTVIGDASTDTLTVGASSTFNADPIFTTQARFTGTTSASFSGTILDGGGGAGTAGQVLSSTGTGVSWISNTAGSVTGTGTVNKLTKWSSGGTGIQNSNITDNGSLVTISSPTDQTGKAIFRTGIVLSSSPGGITVDDTSMVIGAGNNDIISGADHCLAVGNNNQILTNSDNSISVGQGNTMTFGTACAVFGLSNTITGSNTVTERCLVAGFSNTISGGAKSAIVLGGSNSLTTNGGQGIILGNANTVTGNAGVSSDSSYILGSSVTITEDPSSALLQNAFAVGSNLGGDNGKMILGYRNLKSGYPAVDYNQGLGETKFVVSVGTTNTTNSNALIITEGGVTRGTSSVAQVPRIVMPTVVGLNFADDTAAATGGIPIGGLYHNAGALRIRLT
jgi:hypothetical protein